MASDRRSGPTVEPADPVTLERLHEDHAAELSAYCLRLTGFDRARAEDVVQETLLRAWLHAGTLDGSHGSVRGWLCRVARNLVIDEARTARSRRELSFADVPELEQPDGRADELLLSWVVADALQRLSQDHRDVLLQCYYGGASVAEAAACLGVPAGTVKSRTHYALRALRLALEELGVSA